MSITNYSELKTAVASWLKRSDLTSIIPDLIALGEMRIYRDLRIRCMETTISGITASGVVSVPTRYKELKFAYIGSSPVYPLQKKDAEWIHYNYPTRAAGGTPKFIATQGDNFIFGPYPTDGLSLGGVAYCALAPLSDSNTTNWFTANASDLLLFATLCEAEPNTMNDERIPIWEGKYQNIRERIQNEANQEEFSGSPLAITVR